jgi:diguanylate cyclase (GGDEF)-like protein/PAS domain S-box-containing protein
MQRRLRLLQDAAPVTSATHAQISDQLLGRYRLLAENMHDLAIFIGADRRIVEVNASAARTYGAPAEDFVGMPVSRICYSGEGCAIQITLQTGEPRTWESVHRRLDGTLLPVEVSTVRANVGGETLVLCVARDLSHRRRRDLLQSIIHEIDGAILRGDAPETIQEFVCMQLVAINDYALVQISIKESDGSISIRSSAGPASHFLDGIQVRWDRGLESLGPTGCAIREGHTQICDIESDRDFAPWRGRAAACGLRSAIALPLLAHGRAIGALTIFSTSKEAFNEEMDEDMGSFADQIALSILAGEGQKKIQLQREALKATANGIVITDVNGVIEWVNPAFTTLTGWTAEEAIGDTPRILRSGNHSRAFYARMWQQLKAGEVWRGEMYNRRKDGTLYPEEQTITPVLNEKGAIAHFVAVKQDITDRKRQEEQDQFLALHDPLTALPNRRAFEAALTRFGGGERDAAILILDIDDFKLVNDSAGHPAGDQLLMEVTSLLQAQLRPGDFLARLGGDDFVVLIQNAGTTLAHDIAERLRRAVELMSFEHNGSVYYITISIGVALFSSGEDPKSIVAHADTAMYAAKERGKNRIAHDPMDGAAGVHEVTLWLSRIRAALRDGGFVLSFQPVIELGSGEAVHFEALIRMVAADGTLYMPDQFLPCAERYGLMSQIDRWVFDDVMRILESQPDIRIFANLSGRSLTDEPLLRHIEERLGASSIAPGRLSFEITETAAVGDLASARNFVGRLKDLGCLIALDDFGVGFSSFGYLRALAVDYVKIDRMFVRDVDTNATNRALVQAVHTVARTMGKGVIAEGVESEAHANVLREMGIDHGQGYHWGRPVTLDAAMLRIALEFGRSGAVR